MIADLIPLLAFTAVVVIARNIYEVYVLDHERHRLEGRELVRAGRSQSHHGRRVVERRDPAAR